MPVLPLCDDHFLTTNSDPDTEVRFAIRDIANRTVRSPTKKVSHVILDEHGNLS